MDEAPLSRWRIMHVSRIRTCWAYMYVCGRGSSVWKSPFFRWIYVYLLVASALPQVLSAQHFAYIPDPLDDKLWAFYLPTLLLDYLPIIYRSQVLYSFKCHASREMKWTSRHLIWSVRCLIVIMLDRKII